MVLTVKVAVVEFEREAEHESLEQALELIGGLDDLNTLKKPVIVKVGVFSHKADNHASVRAVGAITRVFDKAPRVMLAESDNYQGTGLERLQIWKELYTGRVAPLNLSDESDPVKVKLAGQEVDLPRVLLGQKVLVDTHILRSFDKGSILKNLFGCILDSKRIKYHKILPALLADVYEAIGGVDLAVVDGTYFWQGAGKNPVPMNTLVVGKDAVAVETVGAALAGLEPSKMPVLQEFVKRGLGEGALENIEIAGTSFEDLEKKFESAVAAQKRQNRRQSGPVTWGGKANRALESLIQEGFFSEPRGRTLEDVVKLLERRGLPVEGRERKIADALARRVRKGVLKRCKSVDGQIRWIS
ncbi:MAG: DUF362 domain-containing protein [Candidatus Bathyarchaeota archaeon]|jgi:uncharacterized protein (DUF362 family)|nr:DUF362 domain-containing protein [Candidatus Bathyarchaeota archaeon]